MNDETIAQDQVREQVREGYTKIAKVGALTTGSDSESACCNTGCCGSTSLDVEELVKSIGYTDSELAGVPEAANMGLSCGNPTAIASLKEGETVLDLGSGGGFDVFVAGPKVGASGKVIGVDMTPEMISKARKDTAIYTKHTGLNNVEFRLGEGKRSDISSRSSSAHFSRHSFFFTCFPSIQPWARRSRKEQLASRLCLR